MASSAKTKDAKNRTGSPPNNRRWPGPALLALLLAILFWRSFLPGFVHFSNDGPLGQNMPDWIQPLPGLTGMWDDMNSIGMAPGSWSLSLTFFIHCLLGVLGTAKFFAPLAILILGIGAWAFFRALKFSPLAVTAGALAVMLNSGYFAGACWGVGSQEISIGMIFLALALVVANTQETTAAVRWIRFALAGVCVGFNVMDAGDIGALLSILVAGYVFYKSLVEPGQNLLVQSAKAMGRVCVIACFAGLIAFQTVTSLVSTSIVGIAGREQDKETKAQHWDWATQWSLPKKETLELVVPGLFGYKMDTPKDMMPQLKDFYEGGNYWGGMGRDPAIDRFLDSGSQGTQPTGFMRFTSGTNYCGILVVLVALWTIVQSLRRQSSPFTERERKFIWFWSVLLVVSLLLAWGRFAPMFYGALYQLPYFSTIRNPTKFLIWFALGLTVLFAYGVNVLGRRLNPDAPGTPGFVSQWQLWWARASAADRRWVWGCVAALAASALGWLIYSSQKPALIHYLQKMGFPGETLAQQLAAFSIAQAGWFVPLFAVALGLVVAIIAGCFNGSRARWGAVGLIGFLIFDLVRADLPYVIHWDYKEKYEVGTLNPIVDFLRNKPYEHRVAGLPFRAPSGLELLDEVYRIEWMQHHFPYYGIQSLDVIQMPRMAADLKAYLTALAPDGTPATASRLARQWQLANNRYLLGPAGYLDVLNEDFDPAKKRFRILQRFEISPKPGVLQPSRLEELTAVPAQDGRYALFEFTGALPRAGLYGDWQVNTNDEQNLKTLAAPEFDPEKTVLISTPQNGLPTRATNDDSGTVTYTSYSPKRIVLAASAAVPSVLLLNDKYDPNWRVTVDGVPAPMLRCNFIMRGVQVPPGQHTVEFDFSMPNKPLYVTLAGLVLAVILAGLLLFLTRKPQT